MTNTDVVKKLIGPITPIGQSSEDERRLSNLIGLTCLIKELVDEVANVYNRNKESHEASVKGTATFAKRFLDELSDDIKEL